MGVSTQSTWGHSSQLEKDTMRFFLLASAVVAASLASEDVFLNWAKEQGKQYHTRAEVTKRRDIFMKNYNRMGRTTRSSLPGAYPGLGVSTSGTTSLRRSGRQRSDWE